MNLEMVTVLITIIFRMLFITGITIMFYALYRYFKLKSIQIEKEMEYQTLHKRNENTIIEYSNQALEYIRSIISQITVLQFRKFQDSHDMKLITQANILTLVSEIATTVHQSINITNLSIDETLFTKEFYEKYIIDTTVILVKQMLDDYNQNIEENY